MILLQDLKPFLTRGQLIISTGGGTFSMAVAIYIALCPSMNTGLPLTFPLLLNVAKFQLIGFLTLLFLFITTLIYPKGKETFQKIRTRLKEKEKQKEKEKTIKFILENKDEVISALGLKQEKKSA
ncbi:hypothetical protein COM08_30360 [Bacillus wiedmannii]|uniref:hypothetical protein n=1 Tax=Bacillus wiedmannii TaxID=1890302 RepID=UPI000BF2B8D7|nr:hypothetical protein [Bacillus wiedmannii]PGC10610.1 hypothetical protein COM08_30360 [Bacillus wiedmannii]